MSRTEDLLNDNGPSLSMSIASKAPQKEGGSKSDGLDKDHIAVSSPFCRSGKADGLGQHFNMGEALLMVPTPVSVGSFRGWLCYYEKSKARMVL